MAKRITFFSFLALLLATSSAFAQVTATRLNPSTVEVNLGDNRVLTLDFYGPHIFRVFYDPEGGIIRDPKAEPPAEILVQNPRREVNVTLEGDVLRTQEIEVRVDAQKGLLSVSREGKLVLQQVSPASHEGNRMSLSFAQGLADYFYGGGVQNGRFSHRGEEILIENTNNWVDGGVASPAPFYWSTAGYGMMWYTFSPGRYDFGKTDSAVTTLSHETSYLDLFIMISQGAVALLNDFYQLTGNPVLLPKFGFYEGHLNAYNRDYWTPAEEGKQGFMTYEDGKSYNESQKDNGGIRESLNGEKDNYQFSARAALDRYLDNDYPLGWFLPNDGYGAGYGQTESLEGNVQNLRDFGEYARSRGVEIGLWTQSDLHPKEGVEPLLQRDIVREVRDAGVRVLKTDVAWVGAGYSFGLNGLADVAQIMPYYGHNARPFIISLDGWAGTQRYAASWTGDQTGGEWEYIRFHIPTYIGSGLSGQPNITSDMDGIFGGRNTPVNVRDFQWKTFSPMQLNMDGWGSNPKYPQVLGEPAAGINRWYLKLKSQLLPYTYTIAHTAVTGEPMIRAMFLEEENPFTLGENGTRYQFMYGPSLLVAPIYKETRADEEGNDVRDGIYLPKGQWMDYFTGQVYEGGRIINGYDAPLWKLPFLVKRGAIIPTHKPTNTPTELDASLRCYDLYPGMGDFEFAEYDDDGRTEAYKQGLSVSTLIQQSMDAKGTYRVQVFPAQGSYETFQPVKTTQFRIYCSSVPKKFTLKVNGKKVSLNRVESYQEWLTAPNSWYFGKSDLEHMDIQALMINVAEMDVRSNDILIEAEALVVDTTNHLLLKTGSLAAPQAQIPEESVEAYSLKPQWDEVPNADYYEIEFKGQLYSTICQTGYTLDGLSPHTNYQMRIRAVNRDGVSEWTSLEAATTEDPLKDAIHGMRGGVSCENQPGQPVRHLFDFDLGSTWHTAWMKKAVPFELVVDMRSMNRLDKMQYVPRVDAGNGTLLKGSVEVSTDRRNWTPVSGFDWSRSSEVKEISFQSVGSGTWRYVRLRVAEAVGGFGSGQQLYVFRVPGSEFFIPGDINQDGRVDENDLVSFMNYTGLRKGDGDFEGYISKGDLNQNGLIDVQDINTVAVELEDGVSSRMVPEVAGSVSMKSDKQQYTAGEEVTITVQGRGLVSVNGISLALPYDPNEYEYVGVEAPGMPDMYNMTYDRLHTNGQKALYPTFVNLGEKKYVEGDVELMVLHFRAKKNLRFSLRMQDGMLVDKYGNMVAF